MRAGQTLRFWATVVTVMFSVAAAYHVLDGVEAGASRSIA